MRARNIKPGFFLNEDLAECSPAARLLFIGLWCMADREGKLEYRPRRIRAAVFPYEKHSVEKLLQELETASMLVAYQVDGVSYLKIINFEVHQSPHHTEKESILPNPSDGSVFSLNGELTVKAPLINASRTVNSHRPAVSVISNQDSVISNQESVITIPLINKGKEYSITQKMVDEWKELFPAIDVEQTLRDIKAWNIANPKNRKTKDGILRHITGWMTKAQNRAKGDGNQSDPFAWMKKGANE